ncbi:ABC-F family ATP-binding cassette domain-containing protein [Brochothrix campestris]
MSLMVIENLKYELPDKVLYEEGNLQLNAGDHLGLVGKNGAGKTTLLKILMGEVMPDEGRIVWGRRTSVGYLQQHLQFSEEETIMTYLKTAFERLYQMEAEIGAMYLRIEAEPELLDKIGDMQEELEQHDFYQLESKIETIASGLGIQAIGFDRRLNQLSGGQKSKVMLAKLLLEQPDVLLLDEPTNYLDDTHIEWLTNFLNPFPGSFVVISHDEAFLDGITNCICDIEFSRIKKYPGNLRKALKLKTEANELYLKNYHQQQEKIEKMEKYIQKYKAGSRSTIAKSREKQLNRIERLTPPSTAATGEYVFPYVNTSTDMTISMHQLEIGYEQPLLPPITLSITTGEKVLIKGFNGLGKSTLLKTVLGLLPSLGGEAVLPMNGKINYFSQELEWDNINDTPFSFIKGKMPHLTTKEVRSKLSRSGLTAEHVEKPLAQLSGGEQTKVKLCAMTLVNSHILVMDEPTNHLDKETKRALSVAVTNFPGTVLLVSHEKHFYEGVVSKIVDVESLQLNKM